MAIKSAGFGSTVRYPTTAPKVVSQLPVQPRGESPGLLSKAYEAVKAPVKAGLRGLGFIADIPFTPTRAISSFEVATKAGMEAVREANRRKLAEGKGFVSPSGKRMLAEEFAAPILRPSFYGKFVPAFLKDVAGIGRRPGEFEKVPTISEIGEAGGFKTFEPGSKARLITDIGGEFAIPSPTGFFKKTAGLAAGLGKKTAIGAKVIGKAEKAISGLGKTIREGKVGGVISKLPGGKFFQYPEVGRRLRQAEETVSSETKRIANFVKKASKGMSKAESRIVGQLMENRGIIPEVLASTEAAYKIGEAVIPIARIKQLASIAQQSLGMRDDVVRRLVETGVITEKAGNKFLQTGKGYLRHLYPEHVKESLQKLSISMEDLPPLRKIYGRKSKRTDYIKEFQAPFFVGMAEDIKRVAEAEALRDLAQKYGIQIKRGLKTQDISSLALREFKKIPKIKTPTVSGLGMGAAEQALARARGVSETLGRSGIFVKPEQLLGKVSKGMGILNEPKNIAWDLLAEVAKKTGKLKLDIPRKTNFILEDILMLVKKNARLNAAAKTGEIKGKIADILERAGAAEGSTQAGFVRVVDALGDGFRKMAKEFGANKETLRRAEALRAEVNKRILSLSGGLTGKQGYFYNREIIENALQNPETGDAMKALLKLRDEINDFAGETRGIGTTPEKLGLAAPPAGTIPQEALPPGYKVTPKGQLRKDVPGYVPTPDIFEKVGKSAQKITTFGEPKTKVGLERVGKLPIVKQASLYIPTVREQNFLPEGYETAAKALKGRFEDPQVAQRVLENTALPSDMWDSMLKGRQNIEKRAYVNGLKTVYNGFMSAWKVGKTLMRPAYYVRNMIFNEIMVSNVTGKQLSLPVSIANSMMSYFAGDSNAISKAFSKIVGKQSLGFVKEADEINLIRRDNVTSLAKDILRKYGPRGGIRGVVSRVKFPPHLRNFQQFQEDTAKLEVFSHFRKQGLDSKRAAEIAKEVIFSPEGISRETRSFYSNIWPFFSFTRQAVPATIKYGINNPNTARVLERIEQIMERSAGEIDRRYLPEYFRGHIALPGKSKEGFHRLITTQYVNPYRQLEAGGEFDPFGTVGTNPIVEIFINAILLESIISGNTEATGGIDFFRNFKPVTNSVDPAQRKAELFNFIADKLLPESVLGIPFPGSKSYREYRKAEEGVAGILGTKKKPGQIIKEQFMPFKPQLYSPEKSRQIQVTQARAGLRDVQREIRNLTFKLNDEQISRPEFEKRRAGLMDRNKQLREKIRMLSTPD